MIDGGQIEALERSMPPDVPFLPTPSYGTRGVAMKMTCPNNCEHGRIRGGWFSYGELPRPEWDEPCAHPDCPWRRPDAQEPPKAFACQQGTHGYSRTRWLKSIISWVSRGGWR